MSKSGLFAHFGSKEELQLATIEAARQRFVDEVFRPALQVERGYPRLLALCRSWIDYLRREVFPGGCFFAAASFEFDGRPGPVRDAIGAAMNDWIAALEKAIEMAKEAGHFDPEVDPSQVAFELNSLFFGANYASQLWKDRRALAQAESAIEARLESLRIKPSHTRSRARRKVA